MNNQLNNFIPLDDEEQSLRESFEAGEWQTVSLTAEEKQSYVSAAQRTLKTLEKRQISIKLNPADISVVKAKAQETGIPYQNIIGALIHNYAIGKIKLEI
jgi:predicted DNA binding CopG/RHH family protein